MVAACCCPKGCAPVISTFSPGVNGSFVLSLVGFMFCEGGFWSDCGSLLQQVLSVLLVVLAVDHVALYQVQVAAKEEEEQCHCLKKKNYSV